MIEGILKKKRAGNLPMNWVDLEFYPDSMGYKKEIYLPCKRIATNELIVLFHDLFGKIENDILVYNKSWWDFCLDSWDPINNKNNYENLDKSIETQNYLNLLRNSNIEIGFSGSCACSDWDKFLKIILECIIRHIAPFSPVLYNESNQLFFYFHHTGSIGLYYKEKNNFINELLLKSEFKYLLK
ncbi:hypothetical protein ACNKXS_13505 [Christiangramia marina]|uniref:hypothetical protein n=1 Tax=Christiangramia marina TaxID=409436 RepID=UPI003AA96A35